MQQLTGKMVHVSLFVLFGGNVLGINAQKFWKVLNNSEMILRKSAVVCENLCYLNVLISRKHENLLSGTKIASQNRSDHGGRKRARNHFAAEIAGFLRFAGRKKNR